MTEDEKRRTLTVITELVRAVQTMGGFQNCPCCGLSPGHRPRCEIVAVTAMLQSPAPAVTPHVVHGDGVRHVRDCELGSNWKDCPACVEERR